MGSFSRVACLGNSPILTSAQQDSWKKHRHLLLWEASLFPKTVNIINCTLQTATRETNSPKIPNLSSHLSFPQQFASCIGERQWEWLHIFLYNLRNDKRFQNLETLAKTTKKYWKQNQGSQGLCYWAHRKETRQAGWKCAVLKQRLSWDKVPKQEVLQTTQWTPAKTQGEDLQWLRFTDKFLRKN